MILPIYLPIAAYFVDVVVLQARIQPRILDGVPMLVIYFIAVLPSKLRTWIKVELSSSSVITTVLLLVIPLALLFVVVGLTRLHLLFASTEKETTEDIETPK